jgi:hypothetical protein
LNREREGQARDMAEASGQSRPANRSLFDLDGPAAGRWRPRPAALAGFLVLALLALLVAGAGIARLAERFGWMPDGPQADKLALLRDAGSAEIYFVGASHTLRAVDPAAVDAALAEAGCQGRSVNLGSGGATIADMARIIDRIGALAPGALIVTEGGGLREAWAEDDGTGRHERHAAGLAYLDIALAGTRSGRGAWTRALVPYLDALAAELGKHRLYDALFQAGDRAPLDPALLAGRGYLSAEEQGNERTLARRERFLRQLAKLASPKVDRQARAALAERAPELAASALALVARIRAAGGRPVLLLLPALGSLAAVSARNALALEPGLPAIDLAYDRDLLPFPDPAFFWDQGHLTRDGARIVSHAIGLELCALLRGGL